ncbi:MAG: acyl-CoA reductase [Thermoanaerobaculia bacterium]
MHSSAVEADSVRLAHRLNGPGAEGLAGLGDRELRWAWEGAVAAFLDPGSPERRELGERFVAATGLSPEGVQAGLEAVLGGVRGEPAARLFERSRELRAARLPQAEATSRPPSAGRSFALVVLASNLPALAVQPLLPALAARRPVLLKSPTAEPFFAPAFVRALVERLPALDDAVAARVWAGGEEDLEAPLLERAGVVLAYGGEEALASLEHRARTLGSARFVGYGPKTSLAAIGRDADPEAVAPGLARDVALFDQRGCLSIAAVYAEGGEDRARGVADALAWELGRLARTWPPGPADPAAAGTARQVRAEAELRGLFLPPVTTGTAEPPLAAGTVVVEPRPAFQPTPGLRTVRVHPLADLSVLPDLLEPWRDRLQGAALAAADRIEPALTALGISRITPPGHLQHPDALWHNGGVDPLEALATEPQGAPRLP